MAGLHWGSQALTVTDQGGRCLLLVPYEKDHLFSDKFNFMNSISFANDSLPIYSDPHWMILHLNSIADKDKQMCPDIALNVFAKFQSVLCRL